MAHKQVKLAQNETGLASIIVTLIIMLIISLIVVGFARLSRREQRQALDDQLSTQAFYAAESGINDAIQYIKNNTLTQDYTANCADFITLLKSSTGNSNVDTLDNSTGVKYTCLLVNRAPGNLVYSNVTPDRSIVVPVKPQSGTVDSVTISWQDHSGGNTFCPLGSPAQFTTANPLSSWPCSTGMVRADILPGTGGDRGTLNSNTMTAFFYPTSVNTKNPLNFNPADSGAIAGGGCTTVNNPYCSVTVTFGSAQSQVNLRLKSIYLSTDITVTAKSGGTAVNLVGAQATVDATGKANDILRRIQVRVPLGGSGPFPEFAVQSGDSICKRLQIDPGTGAAGTDAVGGAVAACQIP